MKYFGTVKSFDEVTGHGSITPEIGGENLQFERGAASWYRGDYRPGLVNACLTTCIIRRTAKQAP